MRYCDATLTETSDGYYDLTIGTDGDIDKTNSFDTALLLSIFCERRASETEVEIPSMRRGWLGNLFQAVEYGSKLWLLYQSRLTQSTVNRCRDYLSESLSWLVENNHAQSITVSPVRDVKANTLSATIKILRNDNEIESLNYLLWNNTGA